MNNFDLQQKNDAIEHIRRWPTARSKKWTIEFVDLAKRDVNMLAVVAIGSAVRIAVPSVDLDIIVICKAPPKLKAKPPLEIDLRFYLESDVDHEIMQGNDLLGWAVKFGRVIYQREGYWDVIVESYRNRLPLPSADIFAKRAKESFIRLVKVFEIGDMDAAYEQALSYITHLGRTELLRRKVYPASRPELPAQLRSIGCVQLADWLENLIDSAAEHAKLIKEIVEGRRSSGKCT
jgi:hypothetical protein